MQALKQGRRADYRDVLNAPAHMVAEVIDGALHTQPRPAPRHAWASSELGARINPPFNYGDGGPGGWWIVDEPELHLGEDILVPDLAGWRRERMPDYPDTAWFEITARQNFQWAHRICYRPALPGSRLIPTWNSSRSAAPPASSTAIAARAVLAFACNTVWSSRTLSGLGRLRRMEGTRRDIANDDRDPEHRVGLTMSARW